MLRRINQNLRPFLHSFRGEGKSSVITVALGTILYLSAGIWKSLFNRYIVDEFLSRFSFEGLEWWGLVVYFGVLIPVVIICVWNILKYSYKLKLQNLLIFGMLITLYSVERLSFFRYCHAKLFSLTTLDSKISLLDPIFISAAVILVVLLINRFRNIQYRQNPANVFIQDLPIENINQDDFNRGLFFGGIIDQIQNISFDGTRGFSIGIVSKWGHGKTSFLNILKGALANNGAMVIEFNAWLSPDPRSLTKDFFLTFENHLKKYVETNNIIFQYGKSLSKVKHQYNPLSFISDFFQGDTALEEKFAQISVVVSKINRPIFVLVDDADRLDNDEVFDLLRMLRNSGNFPRMNFIVTYDRDYILKSLYSNKIYKPREYLKKIFDVEFTLPPIPGLSIQSIVFKMLSGLIERTAPKMDADELVEQVRKAVFASPSIHFRQGKYRTIGEFLDKFLQNKRDVIRFYNSFALSFSINHHRAYLPDLLLLELIKQRSLNVYQKISESTYLHIKEQKNNGRRYYELNDMNVDGKQPSFVQKTYHDYNILDKVGEDLRGIIMKLFELPDENDFQAKKSIVFVDNFDAYFSYPSVGLSYDEIDQMLKKDEK